MNGVFLRSKWPFLNCPKLSANGKDQIVKLAQRVKCFVALGYFGRSI